MTFQFDVLQFIRLYFQAIIRKILSTIHMPSFSSWHQTEHFRKYLCNIHTSHNGEEEETCRNSAAKIPSVLYAEL